MRTGLPCTSKRRMKSFPLSDIPLNKSDGNLTSHFFMFSLVSLSSLPVNGPDPLNLKKKQQQQIADLVNQNRKNKSKLIYKTYVSTPTAHISVEKPTESCSTISGAAKSKAAAVTLTTSSGSNLVARPKSTIFNLSLLFVSNTMFSGRMSKCTTLFSCICCRPSHTCLIYFFASCSVILKFEFDILSRRSPPDKLFQISN